jgi:hypothetical protein
VRNPTCLNRVPCLAVAAAKGNVRSVKTLIELGADASLVDSFGLTPLFEAVSRSHAEAAAILRAHGSDMGLRNSSVWEPEGEAAVAGPGWNDKRDAGNGGPMTGLLRSALRAWLLRQGGTAASKRTRRLLPTSPEACVHYFLSRQDVRGWRHEDAPKFYIGRIRPRRTRLRRTDRCAEVSRTGITRRQAAVMGRAYFVSQLSGNAPRSVAVTIE